MQRLYVDWKAILRYGLVLSLIVTIALLIAFSIEPLAFVTDLPLEVQEKIGEIPKRAIPVGWSVFLTVIFSCIGLSILMNRAIFKDKSGKATFINLLRNTFLLLNFFNKVKVLLIRPEHPVPNPGKSRIIPNILQMVIIVIRSTRRKGQNPEHRKGKLISGMSIFRFDQSHDGPSAKRNHLHSYFKNHHT